MRKVLTILGLTCVILGSLWICGHVVNGYLDRLEGKLFDLEVRIMHLEKRR